jgi:CheY-like chemotaxis protein
VSELPSDQRPTRPVRVPFVFVVDDDEDFRESLVDALRGEGYAVQSAPDGRAALAALEAGAVPAVVLLDLWMPHMDGWQLRHALQQPPYADIPVIVMTAVGPQDTKVLRVNRVLEKPFGVADVVAAIRHEL